MVVPFRLMSVISKMTNFCTEAWAFLFKDDQLFLNLSTESILDFSSLIQKSKKIRNSRAVKLLVKRHICV